MKSFGDTLKELRASRGFTMSEFAEYLALPLNTYKSYEQGLRVPKADKLVAIAKALNVSTDYLLGDENAPKHLSPLLMFNSEDEERAIKKLRRLPDPQREAIFNLLDALFDAEMARQNAELEKPSPEYTYIDGRYFFSRPSAGSGNEAFDESAPIRVKDSPVARKADFFLQIDGRSMEPRYPDGAMVAVKHSKSIDDGDVGVFFVDGELYIKQQQPGRLHSLNPDYDDIELSEFSTCETFGKVIGIVEV